MGLISDILSGDLKRRRVQNQAIAKLYEGGRITTDRNSASATFDSPEDSTKTSERLQVIREARELEDDFPLANMILDTFDTYAFESIRYQPMTGSLSLNREISEWLKLWMDDCDYQGRFDFDTLIKLAQRGKKRDGESGFIHIEDSGEYRLQLITGERIGNPTVLFTSQDEDQNGIRLDKYGRVSGYDIYKKSQAKNGSFYVFDTHVPESWFSHLFDPTRVDSYHGVSIFKSVITRMRDLKETMDYSRTNIKYRSTQLPYFKTEDGAPPSSALNFRDGLPKPITDKDGVTLEQVAGGEQSFLRTTEGIFDFPNDFPNQQFLPMVETEVKEIFAGVNLSYDFLWKIDKLTGTVGRLVVEREDRVMQAERKNMERQCMRTIIKRAIEAGYRAGAIKEKSPKKFEGEFFYGAKISADYGRDAKADVELVNAGLLSETEYHHIHGRSPDKARETRIEETKGLIEDAKILMKEDNSLSLENALNLLRKVYPQPPVIQSMSEQVQPGQGSSF